MSRAWMPMYWGDYLRDTRDLTTLQHGAYLLLIAHYWQHERLPTDEKQLAAIAGLSVLKWRAINGPIAAKFSEGWTHHRIDRELSETERRINQRVIAGSKGGMNSGISRSILKGQSIIEAERKRSLASRSSGNEANGQAGTKQPRTNHKEEDITTSEYGAAREGADRLEENPSVVAMRERLSRRPRA